MAVLIGVQHWELAVRGTALGQAIVNVMHFRTSPGFGAEATTTAELLFELARRWQSSGCLGLHVTYAVALYHMTEILRVTNVDPNNPASQKKIELGHVEELGPAILDAGQSVGLVAPTLLAAGFTKRTAIAGGKGKGAIRLSPIRVVDVENNDVVPAFRNANGSRLINVMFKDDLVKPDSSHNVVGCVFQRTGMLRAVPNAPSAAPYMEPITNVIPRIPASSQVTRKTIVGGGA